MIPKLIFLVILASSFSASVARQPDVSCSLTEFRCRTGGCISLNLICDGSVDCADGGDELGCDKGLMNSSSPDPVLFESRRQALLCRKNEWTCWDGSCIPSRFRCDGVVDCDDGSDENIDACRTFVYMRSLTVVAKLSGAYKQNSLLEGPNVFGNLLGAGVNTSTAYLPRKQYICELPEYPAFGTYNAINITNAKPGDAYDTVTIEIICRDGYGVNGVSVVKCQNGAWLAEIPKCVSNCYLPPHHSVEYRCLFAKPDIGNRKCKIFEPIGTVVSPQCRPNYYSPTPIMYMRCNDHGKWDDIVKCIPECGTVTGDGVGLIYNGRSAKKAEVPWHAGIYTKKKHPYVQICGGSVISNKIVISAAHCFWEVGVGMLPTTDYAVATGKLYRPWNERRDEAQKSDVKELHLPEHFQGSTSHFQTDIAVVITTMPFKYNEFVRPVCLNFDTSFEKLQLKPGNMGKVAGWGLTGKNGRESQVLKVIDLPYVSTGQCINESIESFRPYIAADKICAGYTKGGKAVCKGDSGGGLAFPSTEQGTNRYYLRGIVSTAPTHNVDDCYTYGFMAFTQLLIHEHFIKEFWTAEDVSSTDSPPIRLDDFVPNRPLESICKLPPYPDHGTYITNIPEAKPGGAFNSVIVNITCQQGYGVNASSSVYCINGRWSEKMPKCVSQCHLKPHPSVEYRCLITGLMEGFRPCKEYEVTGTVVSPQCRTPNYYSPTALSFMRCIDGSWDYVAKCSPECGTVTSAIMPLINGEMSTAKLVEVPWQALIYLKSGIDYGYRCGGSLISSSAVLSAGHCFWSEFLKQPVPASEYAVAVGKLYRSWSNTSHDEQRSEVKAVHLSERYRGDMFKYQDDIAVVIIESPFKYTLFVRPVCLDFDIRFERKQLQPGIIGKMVNWPGLRNSNRTLQVLDLPYINITTCFSKVPKDFREYITRDKICVEFTDSSGSVCPGNSGSGLAFPELTSSQQRFYIRGILSSAPTSQTASLDARCHENTILTFTQILPHERFIKQFLETTGADDGAKRSQKGNCKLPDYPDHGTYTTNITDAKPGDAFDAVTINVTCIRGDEVVGSNTVFCSNGWWPEKLPKCVSQCHLKPDPSIDYRCLDVGTQHIDGYRPCKEYEVSGTVVSPECRRPVYYSATTLAFMRCINGNWDYIPRCIPDCGTLTPDSAQTNTGGQAATLTKVPWHADIYTKTTDPYKKICGGSLISESVIISAAHCFWSTDGQEPATNFAVAVDNELSYLWEASKNKVQRSDVLKVHLPVNFQGAVSNYQADLAVVTVVKPVEFSASIRPVCVDFDANFERSQLRQGQIGKLAGGGLTIAIENEGQAFRVVDVSHVNVETCFSEAPVQLREFITTDKICGKLIDSITCAGDSGSGLAFPASEKSKEKYYLRGVLTSGAHFNNKCSERGVTALFTRLQNFENFIQFFFSR